MDRSTVLKGLLAIVCVSHLGLGLVPQLSGGVVLEYTKVRKPCYVLDSIDPQLKTDVVGRCGGYCNPTVNTDCNS